MNVLKVSIESFIVIGEDKLAKNLFDSIINSVLTREVKEDRNKTTLSKLFNDMPLRNRNVKV